MMLQKTHLATAALACCAAMAVHAQQNAPMNPQTPSAATTDAVQPQATQLPAINVTAKGYEANAHDTPVAIFTLQSQKLQRQRPHNLAQALRNTAGMAMSADGAQGANPVIRGLKKESIVLLVDGVRLNSAQPVGAVASLMSLDLAEQVEVVKGPASVLYGTGALGGAIHVRLPQARLGSGLKLRTTLGWDSAQRSTRGAAVLHAGGDEHALMVAASAAHNGNYRTPSGTVARTGFEHHALAAQYRFKINERQQLRASVQQHTERDAWYPATASAHPHPMARTQTMLHSPRQQRRLYELGWQLQRSAAQPWGADVRLYRQEVHRSVHNWAERVQRDIATTAVNFTTTGMDARIEHALNAHHLLSWGINTWQMRANPDSAQYGPPPLFAHRQSQWPFRNGRITAMGFYVQDDMQFDNWHVLAGLRHDRVKGSAAALNNGTTTQGLARTDSSSSASLGVLYEASALLRPYANISRAFRAADMRERFQSGPRHDGWYWMGSPQLTPEQATQLELGIKGESERLRYNASIFRNRISNYITGVQITGAAAAAGCTPLFAAHCRASVNLGSISLEGIEASVQWQPVRGHWLLAQYSRIRGKNHDWNEPLYQVPADSLTLGWQGELSPAWSADAQLRIVAAQHRVATRFSRGTEDATAGYATLDLGLGWQLNPNHSLRVQLNNALNRRYHDHLAIGLPGREVAEPGRSLGLSWTAQF